MRSGATIPVAVISLALLAAVPPAHPQVATGVLLGAVHDPSGAAVPGAEVNLTARKTGIATTTLTGPEGGFVFPQVAAGEYTLSVALAGFRRHERTGIVINVNQKARVDVTLELGQVTDSVTVAAAAPLVNSVDGEVGQTVVQKNIIDLPLKGRQFLELAFLTTGTVNAPPADTRVTFQGLAPAVNGNSPEHNSYTLNGASNRQMHNGFFGVVPSVDAVEEFKIQNGSFNAEYGQAGGAIVNVITKSGSNQYRGNVYEFLRNDILNARNFFNPARSAVRQNQFGGTLGGPILHNRTFFFFNYEGFRERRASTRSSRFPTPKQLAGDFSGEAAVRDPVTGQNFAGNVIPESRVDPISRKYAAFFPATNPNLSGTNNYINNRPLSNDVDAYGIRIDHKVSDKDNVYGSVNWDNTAGITPGPVFPRGPGDLDIQIRNRLFNLTHNHIFTPRSINELRLSYLRFNHLRLDSFKGRDFVTELGISGITTDPFIRLRFPDVSFGQGFSGLPRSVDQGWIDNIYQIQDNFSWVRQRHSMKFGFGFASPRNISTFIANAPVSYTFSGRFSGNAIADFLLGSADSTSTFLRGGIKHVNNQQFSFYAQDQWQVGRSLTLTYGLRYELHTPYIDPAEEATSVNTATGALRITRNANITEFQKIFTYPVERLSGRNLYDTHACCLGPLMPRFGFAWQLPRELVVRGGYALSLDTEVGNMLNGALAAPAWIRTGLTETVFPGIGYNSRRASLANIFPVGIQPIEDGFREGYTQNWNITLEKELHSKDLLSVAYVGSKGTHLLSLGLWNEAPPGFGSLDLRRPFPQFGTASLFSAFGASNYHSLQAKAERRFANGLGYLTGYTYSKGIGNTSTVNEGRILTGTDQRSGRGRLGFDVRQRFTAAGVYELPFGPGKRFAGGNSRLVGKLVGGWQVNTITAFQTGYPINLAVSPCQLNGFSNRCVPNLNGPDHGNLPRDVRTVDRWFNTAAFSAPAAFTQGNQQQYTLDGPGINNWDTSFVKNTRIGETMNVQFRAEFFNFFNHTRFSGLGTTLGAGTFGRAISSTGEREVQLALKLYF